MGRKGQPVNDAERLDALLKILGLADRSALDASLAMTYEGTDTPSWDPIGCGCCAHMTDEETVGYDRQTGIYVALKPQAKGTTP